MFISLLLVTVGIVYNKTGNSINVAISISFDGENISFDASLVMYTNYTNIPPIMITNRMYENQNLLYIVLLMRHTVVVCIKSISPMAIGCFICVNINLVIVLTEYYYYSHRITCTKCHIDTVISPDDGHIVARNMQRKEINILRKTVHQVDFIYKIIGRT